MRGLRFFVDKNMVMAAFRKSLLKVSGNAVYNGMARRNLKETEEN